MSFVGEGLMFLGGGCWVVVCGWWGSLHAVHVGHGWGLLFVAMVVPCGVHVVTVSEIVWSNVNEALTVVDNVDNNNERQYHLPDCSAA